VVGDAGRATGANGVDGVVGRRRPTLPDPATAAPGYLDTRLITSDSAVHCAAAVAVTTRAVGAATWDHSTKAVRAGGRIVVSGATSGAVARLDLGRLFARQIQVIGSTMGTRAQLERLAAFCACTGTGPHIDRAVPLSEAREAMIALAHGEILGKAVLVP
jgi:D-arabinose 1-dehydrogenase-like Zn-dependent alcohol dehydrogenase